jgi:hypothetical protein
VHIIFQYYNDANSARQAEIDECLTRNLEAPFVECVHTITEEHVSIPEHFAQHSKLCISSTQHRLTYQGAIEYANAVLPEGAVVAIINADIYFPPKCTNWAEIAEPGKRGVFDPDLRSIAPRALILSRYELTPQREPYRHRDSYVGHSQDAWIFKTPISLLREPDFSIGNAPSCDNRIAWILSISGYELWNWAEKYQVHHLDIARKGSEVTMLVNAATDQGLIQRSDLGYKFACPQFPYHLYLNTSFGDDNHCERKHIHWHFSYLYLLEPLRPIVRSIRKIIKRFRQHTPKT